VVHVTCGHFHIAIVGVTSFNSGEFDPDTIMTSLGSKVRACLPWAKWLVAVALVASAAGGETPSSRDQAVKRIAMIIGENEYHTWETLPEFAHKELEPRGYQVSFVLSSPKEGDTHFADYEAIKDADLIVISVRRRTPPKPMMALIRAHVDSGKPVAGIRTACHAFDAAPPNSECAAWPGFDVEVLGGKYGGHYGNKPPEGAYTVIDPVDANGSHLVLVGVKPSALRVTSHLYKFTNLSTTSVVLLRGRVEGTEKIEPVAWVNTAKGRRVFFTSLGNLDDFQSPMFRRLLLNGITWCLGEKDPVKPQ